MTPLVSVIITTYNQAPYIGETLASVLAQTYRHFEVIVVDDGSPDNTAEVVAPFLARIRYIRQSNAGVAGARNTGIECARGTLLAFLDGDDLWEPQQLEVQVAAAERHPGSGMIVVDALYFSDSGIISESTLSPWIQHAARTGEVTRHCHSEVLQGTVNISTTSQVMIPAHVFRVVGVSDTTLPVSSDFDLYLKIACRFDVTFINRVLVRKRHLPTTASGPIQRRSLHWGEDVTRILKRHARETSGDTTLLVRQMLKWKIFSTAQTAYYYGCTTDRTWAARYLIRMIRRNPTSPWPVIFLTGLGFPAAITSAGGPLVRRVLNRRAPKMAVA